MAAASYADEVQRHSDGRSSGRQRLVLVAQPKLTSGPSCRPNWRQAVEDAGVRDHGQRHAATGAFGRHQPHPLPSQRIEFPASPPRPRRERAGADASDDGARRVCPASLPPATGCGDAAVTPALRSMSRGPGSHGRGAEICHFLRGSRWSVMQRPYATHTPDVYRSSADCLSGSAPPPAARPR